MSYDINVLCMNQDNVSVLPFASEIELRNEIDFPNLGRYYSVWPFMCKSKGIWYSIGKDNDGYFNPMSIVDADFDNIIENSYIPYWVSDDEVKSNIKPLIVNAEYKNDFMRIIEFLLKQSPSRTIMFLGRYQGGEKEIVYGVLERQEFIKLLIQSKVLFNVCYIISDC
ncbi:hypothetical protein acsn021_02460 [Anaerocolumna cellulosilytica]|uniref:Uncharacterized protein n=1 Tax=Anaerocolumna cellulosilytica TaxID=433286 RepID=A0A6S6QXT1_9FIRM|nr:hypothetical protein [Anaerocolumna cellulosilytica]MBB5196923.1 hypothetical protein [Anaerocolumna cellulosilytica]BCJ92677.1 hypothetical protein acsn021_02460 [Anaerocolumna cellulosilytica]